MCRLSLLFFLSVICGTTLQDQEPEYHGLLTPACVQKYSKLIQPYEIAPRHYKYYHEYITDRSSTQDNALEDDVGISWRIVGGNKITIHDAPYQVLYGKYCGGVLIAPEWVLTAAHCKTKEKFIYAGTTSRKEAKEYRICAHFIHPLWNKTQLHSHDYDFQLILLEEPVQVTPSSRPIAIGFIKDIKPGILVSVTGWGYLKYKANKMQDILHRVYVPVISQDECKGNPNGNYVNITERMFCAGYMNGSKDSCQGDSGSPVVYQGKLLGIVSYGIGCGDANYPGVYASVPQVRAWIRSITSIPL